MDLVTIGAFIREVGFPVFVATYVLIRLETAINRLQEAIHSSNKSIRLLSILVARQQGTSLEEIERQFGNGR